MWRIQCFIKQQIDTFSLKQPFRGVLKKMCSENMQQIYTRTPMPKYHFNKVAKQLYWNHTSAWVFSEHLFLRTDMDACFSFLEMQERLMQTKVVTKTFLIYLKNKTISITIKSSFKYVCYWYHWLWWMFFLFHVMTERHYFFIKVHCWYFLFPNAMLLLS